MSNTKIKEFDEILAKDIDVGKDTKKKKKTQQKKTVAPKKEKSEEELNKDLRNKFMSIISSMDVQDEEKENIKEICADLEAQYGIKPKIAKKTAKGLRDPEIIKKMEDEQFEIEQLLAKIK